MKKEGKTKNKNTKKLTSLDKRKNKKQEKSQESESKKENKQCLKPTDFPEAIVEVIINKIISYVVRQKVVKEVYTNMDKKCFSYLKYLINPYLSTEYINYENGLDNLELQRKKINYKTIVTEKVNTWEYFPEPKTPGMDRYSSSAAKLISLKLEFNENKDEHKHKDLKDKLFSRKPSFLDKNLIVSESDELIKSSEKIIKAKTKIFKEEKKKKLNDNKKEEIKEKEKEIKKYEKKEEDKIIDLPYEDLPKEKYENKYRLINQNEENNELRREREYLIKKKNELKAILDIQDKKDKLKKFQNRLQKNIDGSKQTFDPEGNIMQIHSPNVDNLNNEFNIVKIPNILNQQKGDRRETFHGINRRRKSSISKFSSININKKNLWEHLPQDIRDIFNYIKDVLIPKCSKKPYVNFTSIKKEKINEQNDQDKKKSTNAHKSFKAFFGPFLRKYIFKANVIRNPADIMKNNLINLRIEKAKQKHSSSPSGSNFNLIKPEIGVVIEDKSNRKKEIKDGGFEYIKKYNKPSMYEFSKLVVETSNLNSLNSRALSSGLIESKVSEINEYKNRNKFQELNQDNYNGYIFEFSDNLNPLFQNALSLNDNQKKEEDKKNLNINNNNDINDIKEEKEEKEEDIYKNNKNIFRAMEEGYLKSRYNSLDLINSQKSIQLSNRINNLYSYFEDNEFSNIKKNGSILNTLDLDRHSKNYSALRIRKKNNHIINPAPLPQIKVHRINVNKSEIREIKNKIKGRKILNKFNYKIIKDKRWGEEDENINKERNELGNKITLKKYTNKNNLLKRIGENIMTNDNNSRVNIKKGLIKSASVGNIF